eukprot:8012553-Ditylum_brightwellii.AAC.1
MEVARAKWTTYNNLSKWFDTLSKFFISHGFARTATEINKAHGLKGELYFFDNQLHWIVNLDESEVTTNGTTKLSGGRQ